MVFGGISDKREKKDVAGNLKSKQQCKSLGKKRGVRVLLRAIFLVLLRLKSDMGQKRDKKKPFEENEMLIISSLFLFPKFFFSIRFFFAI